MPDAPRLLTDLCSLPTAAFREEAVYAYVEAWAKKRKRVTLESDKVGNRLLTLAGKDPKLPRLVLVAHTDHPAFVAMGQDGQDVRAEFRGGVKADNAKGARVRFFCDGEPTGKAGDLTVGKGERLEAATIRVQRGKVVPKGTVGMFDFGGRFPRVKKGLFEARACDDLAGVASALAALERLARRKLEASVCVLLTRAEEVGFIGAIAAAKDRAGLLRKSDRIISIETSSAQPAAPIGEGCVLRIGDKTSVFHSGLSYFINTRGEALSAEHDDFEFRRALMPGGTCEGTAFDAFGYIAAAVCVPLGNYHNMDRDAGTMGPEQIDLGDWHNLVRLLADLARTHHAFDGRHKLLRDRLSDRFAAHAHLFDDATLPLDKPTRKRGREF